MPARGATANQRRRKKEVRAVVFRCAIRVQESKVLSIDAQK